MREDDSDNEDDSDDSDDSDEDDDETPKKVLNCSIFSEVIFLFIEGFNFLINNHNQV